ncbi:MAG TPA: tetratricopeptide repeat protein [Opitutaceae bacterium]|nr:tetratricopeptide repeat protein [Opitutaceae bacterium]
MSSHLRSAGIMMGSRHDPPRPPEPGAASSARRSVALAGAVLVLAVFAAYANSWSGPFVYDDKDSIVDNLTLRRLWPLSEALAPPGGDLTVSGRPALNLSLALNFAAGGLDVRGYHAVNILIHALACLTLFGLARRTLALPSLRARFGRAAVPVAFTVAALWALHPLQSEGVTYIVQRAESLMGLFYLLTLYGFVRSLDAPAPGRWRILSVAACLAGMATKENMVSAPVLVLLFDRAFVAGGFAEAWRRRRGFHAALASTWILLGWLLVSTGGNRGGSAGFGLGVSWWTYALTQFPALVHYLRLSCWPTPLIFAYDTYWIGHLADVWLQAGLVLALVAGTLSAWWRRPAVGFLGAWFFAVLAPTSLIPGTTQQIVEHRMYLPLAPVVVLIVTAVHLASGRRGLAALLALAAGLGFLTHQRNACYRSEIALWSDTVAKQPANASAHSGLGAALADAGRIADAIREDETTLRLNPTHLTTRNNLGAALIAVGRIDEAIQQLEESLRQDPDSAQAHLNLGAALALLKRTPEAMAHYEAALRRDPNSAQAHANLGDALSRSGRNAEAIAHLREALRLKPGYVAVHYSLATALARAGRLEEAQTQFAAGLRHTPADAEAYAHWGGVLLAIGHPAEALAQFESALRLQPDSALYSYNCGSVLAAIGRLDEAVRQFETALRLQPDYLEAHNNLGNALTLLGREAEALPHYEAALRLNPSHPSAHNNLGLALARLGRLPEAAAQFAEALRLAPDYQEARDNLARAQEQLRAAPPRD